MNQERKNELFKEFTDFVYNRYKEKNELYADSFNKTIQKYGMIAGLIQISHKFNRIEAMITNPDLFKNSKSLRDEIVDLVTFLVIMTVSEQEVKELCDEFCENHDGLPSVTHSHINIHCSGTCAGLKNECGLGGYGAVFHFYDVTDAVERDAVSGIYSNDDGRLTPQAVDIVACIQALKHVVVKKSRPSVIDLYTESQYVASTYNEKWDRNANNELWNELDRMIVLVGGLVRFHAVKTEDKNIFGNEADALALKAIREHKKNTAEMAEKQKEKKNEKH